MTRTERLERSWRVLEMDVRSKMREADHQLRTAQKKRRAGNPDSLFPSMQSTQEIIQDAYGSAYASLLDCIHTAMRELGLRYD